MVGTDILDINYNEYVRMLGTAHFTRRSLLDAYKAVEQLKPTDLAIELDMARFQLLNQRCGSCPRRNHCIGRCEFLGAADALGNVNADIWLIDMSEREIFERIHQRWSPFTWHPFSLVRLPLWRPASNEVDLWERGYKDEVLDRHSRRLEALRRKAPHIWRVLIDERNALMAARLAWIVTQKLNSCKDVKVLALTGAAHVDGIQRLLSAPSKIAGELQSAHLRFIAPTRIRRVCVN